MSHYALAPVNRKRTVRWRASKGSSKAQGLSNRDIARRLSISSRTVQSHVQHIYTKIGMSTRAGAAMFAMRHDLIA